MQLSPITAIAIQLPLLIVATVALLRGPRGVRWLRVMLLGLAWLLVSVVVDPIVVTDDGLLADVPVVPAVAIAGLLGSFLAASAELRRLVSVAWPATAGILVLAAVLLTLDQDIALAVALVLWVVGTLHLGWTFRRSAARHPGSLLEARLRMLAGAQWLLASAAMSVLGGPFLIVWVLPMTVGTAILVVAVAPPSFLRLAPSQTRAAMRRTESHLAAIGPDDPDAIRSAVEGVRAVLGAEVALLVDDGAVVVEAGDPHLAELARRWSADPATVPTSGHELAATTDGHWVLAGDTRRGAVIVLLSPVGALLSRTDRELVDGIAERLGMALTREQARRADERATASIRAAERMRDDMLSTLSHELRTPLTTIMGFAEVLRSHADMLSQEQFRDMLTRIVDRGMQLEMIVSALLDLTAIRGRSEPERIAVYQVHDLAEHAATRARERLGGRAVEVRSEHCLGDDVGDGADGGVVHTDGGAVLAILEQLLDNAGKFSEPNSTIHLVVTGDTDEVSMEVRNQGVGLGDLGERAFEPFVRGGEVLTRATGGVGLGLTIARELALQLGGTLQAVGVTDGVAFRLSMPRRHALAPRGDPRTPLTAVHAEGDPTLVPSGRRGDVSAAAQVRGSG